MRTAPPGESGRGRCATGMSAALGERLADRVDDAIGLERLDDEVLRAELQRLDDLRLLAQRRAHDDAGRGVAADDVGEGGETVLLRHRDVERREVGLELLVAGHGLHAVACLPDDLMAGAREGVLDHLAHERGVVDDEDAGHGVSFLSLSADYATVNWLTRRSSSSAVRASSWADAAICCVEALVCCVEAETCSEDADDCSATAATSVMSDWTWCELDAICSIAAAICSTRPFMSCTDAPSARNDSRASSTVATPSSVRRAPSSTTSTALAVSAWISPMSPAIEPAADWLSSASLRTSSATTAKPRPCSPARAASMAAFSASRLVCWAMPVIVATMPSICSDLAPSSRIASVACSDESRTAPMASLAWATAPAPCSATSRAAVAASAVCWALSAPAALAVATSSVASLACSTARTWRSAPWATSPTADAISPTARPASSEVVAICCDAADSDCAEFDTLPTSPPSCARVSS